MIGNNVKGNISVAWIVYLSKVGGGAKPMKGVHLAIQGTLTTAILSYTDLTNEKYIDILGEDSENER